MFEVLRLYCDVRLPLESNRNDGMNSNQTHSEERSIRIKTRLDYYLTHLQYRMRDAELSRKIINSAHHGMTHLNHISSAVDHNEDDQTHRPLNSKVIN